MTPSGQQRIRHMDLATTDRYPVGKASDSLSSGALYTHYQRRGCAEPMAVCAEQVQTRDLGFSFESCTGSACFPPGVSGMGAVLEYST